MVQLPCQLLTIQHATCCPCSHGREQASPKHPFQRQQLYFQTQSSCQHDNDFVTSLGLSFFTAYTPDF